MKELKKIGIRLFSILLMTAMSAWSFPLVAQDYEKTVVVEDNQVTVYAGDEIKEVNLEDEYSGMVKGSSLYPNDRSPGNSGEQKKNRITVKNGETLLIDLNSFPNLIEVSDLSGGNLLWNETEKKIEITSAGSVYFYYKTQASGEIEKKWLVIIGVNYHGVLQWSGVDLPGSVYVVPNGDPKNGKTIDGKFYLSENQMIGVPIGKFEAIDWRSNGATLHPTVLRGTNQASLSALLATDNLEFEIMFDDGTSNGSNENFYPRSFDYVHLVDQRIVANPPVISTTSLPNAQQGVGYSSQLQATGTAPISWSVVSGTLPAGLSVSQDGKISGTPTNHGTFTFTVNATNSVGSDEKSLNLTVVPQTYAITAIATPENGGTIIGAGTYNTGSDVTLKATANEGYAFVSWTESETVVSISATYSFTASSNRSLVANFEIATIPVTGVTLNKTELSLVEGGMETLIASVSPTNASDQSVTWSSSNSSVASVDADGKVNALQAGTATITVKTVDGGKTATCAVTVSAAGTDPTGLIELQNQGIRIFNKAEYLFVITEHPQLINVFTLDGQLLHSESTGNLQIMLPAGVYVLQIGEIARKIIVGK